MEEWGDCKENQTKIKIKEGRKKDARNLWSEYSLGKTWMTGIHFTFL
jgi:hypothetical protein